MLRKHQGLAKEKSAPPDSIVTLQFKLYSSIRQKLVTITKIIHNKIEKISREITEE